MAARKRAATAWQAIAGEPKWPWPQSQAPGGGATVFSAALARYTPSIQQLVEELCQELITKNTQLPLAGRMRRSAFAVIATTVLGLDCASRDAMFADFEIWTRALFSIPLAIRGSPFAKAMATRQRLLNRIKKSYGGGATKAALIC